MGNQLLGLVKAQEAQRRFLETWDGRYLSALSNYLTHPSYGVGRACETTEERQKWMLELKTVIRPEILLLLTGTQFPLYLEEFDPELFCRILETMREYVRRRRRTHGKLPALWQAPIRHKVRSLGPDSITGACVLKSALRQVGSDTPVPHYPSEQALEIIRTLRPNRSASELRLALASIVPPANPVVHAKILRRVLLWRAGCRVPQGLAYQLLFVTGALDLAPCRGEQDRIVVPTELVGELLAVAEADSSMELWETDVLRWWRKVCRRLQPVGISRDLLLARHGIQRATDSISDGIISPNDAKLIRQVAIEYLQAVLDTYDALPPVMIQVRY